MRTVDEIRDMRPPPAIFAMLLACGPVIAEPGDASVGASASTDDGTSPDDTTTADSPPSVTTLPSVDESSGVVDGSSEGGETGTPPEIPPLPLECPGDALLGDALQPREVYLGGTLSEGACYLDALAHWSTPNDAVAGFDCYFDKETAMIRPTDGRLVYTNIFEGLLREYHCDTCPIAAGQRYPTGVLDNDTILPTPMCSPGKGDVAFRVAPDGSYAYRCPYESIWYDDAGVAFLDELEEDAMLLHLGYDGFALLDGGVLDRVGGPIAPIEGLPLGVPAAIRAAEVGFYVVTTPAALWHVAADGEATWLEIYPPAPVGHTAHDYAAALDGCGALYTLGDGPGSFEDEILRRTIEGDVHVVYNEHADPLVKIHISALITGP